MSGVWNQMDPKFKHPYFGGSEVIEKFESGSIVTRECEPMTTAKQYYWNGITLIIVGNDADECDNFTCQKAKLKGEKFRKVASARMDTMEADAYREVNNKMIETLKANGVSLSDKDAVRLPRLNESTDLETVILVHNILKEKYNVDIQREGVQA